MWGPVLEGSKGKDHTLEPAGWGWGGGVGQEEAEWGGLGSGSSGAEWEQRWQSLRARAFPKSGPCELG